MTTLIPKFEQPATSASNRPINLKLQETVSIADFGAVADWNGTSGTDNTAFINAAFAYIKTTGGTLFFPKGSYYCSNRIGNEQYTVGDYADNVQFVGEEGTKLFFNGSTSMFCVVLQGNNVAVRNLTVNSTRTIDYRAPLDPQRTVYQFGIVVGGKYEAGTLSDYKTGAQVSNCQVYNMNLPIGVAQTSNVIVENNIVDEFTDTGILINDCPLNILVQGNSVTRGGDDCFFARALQTSPWTSAGNACRNINVTGNYFYDTFGKNAGFGGYGDVICSNNYCGLSYAGGINIENYDFSQANAGGYRNVLIDGNVIENPGQNWNTSFSANYQAPAEFYAGSGVRATRPASDKTKTYYYQNVTISNNFIINPYWHCVAIDSIDNVSVTGNTFNAGSWNHGSGSTNTQGATVFIINSTVINVIANNTVNKSGINFQWAYWFDNSVDSGIGSVRVFYNSEYFSTALFKPGAPYAAQTFYAGQFGVNITDGATNGQYLNDRIAFSASNYYVLDANTQNGVKLVAGATAWAAQSDENLKDIIEPITNGASKVASLRAVIGKYKTDAEGTRRPFLIAQDVQSVLPEAVDSGEWPSTKDGKEYLSIRYTDVIPLLVSAIQELSKKVTTLEEQVIALKVK